MSYNYKHIICSNCGLAGHIFKKCRKPKISLGIIAFKQAIKKPLKFLMIRRKDTHGFVEFIRGKYELCDIPFIQRLIDEMTLTEKHLIMASSYLSLWKKLWLKDSLDSIADNQICHFYEQHNR